MSDAAMTRAITLIGIYGAMPLDGLDGHACREHDNQWEQGDGDEVFALLADFSRRNRAVAASLIAYPASRYVPAGLQEIAREALGRRDHQPLPAGSLFDEVTRNQQSLL